MKLNTRRTEDMQSWAHAELETGRKGETEKRRRRDLEKEKHTAFGVEREA